MKISKTRKTLDRLKILFQTDTDKELAEELGITYGALTNWTARDSIPYAQLVDVLCEKGVDLNILNLNLLHYSNEPSLIINPTLVDLQHKHSHYRAVAGTKVVERLDEEIKALIKKYDNFVQMYDDLMKNLDS